MYQFIKPFFCFFSTICILSLQASSEIDRTEASLAETILLDEESITTDEPIFRLPEKELQLPSGDEVVLYQTFETAEKNLLLNCMAITGDSFQMPYRILSNKDPNGFVLGLDDGSSWRVVKEGDAKKVVHWFINDRLVIYPTLFPAWSGARFYVFNERLSDTVYVELSLGPVSGLASTNEICWISPEGGLCQLIDGIGRTSNWAIHPEDIAAFMLWQPHQAVILGALTGSFSSWFSRYNSVYILINVENNAYVRAMLQ